MNPETRLTEDQRRLLGEPAAGELDRDERWLADRLAPAPLPAAVRDRLNRTVAVELHRQRQSSFRRFRWAMELAAVLVFGLLVGLFVRLIAPNVQTSAPNPANSARVVAEANAAVSRYLAAIDPAEVQMHVDLERLDSAVATPDGQDNPWEAITAVIQEPAGRR